MLCVFVFFPGISKLRLFFGGGKAKSNVFWVFFFTNWCFSGRNKPEKKAENLFRQTLSILTPSKQVTYYEDPKTTSKKTGSKGHPSEGLQLILRVKCFFWVLRFSFDWSTVVVGDCLCLHCFPLDSYCFHRILFTIINIHCIFLRDLSYLHVMNEQKRCVVEDGSAK